MARESHTRRESTSAIQAVRPSSGIQYTLTPASLSNGNAASGSGPAPGVAVMDKHPQ